MEKGNCTRLAPSKHSATKRYRGYVLDAACIRELLIMLDIEGCIVVADAPNCQKDTAKVIIVKPLGIRLLI
jgi:hypothetical protein